MKIRRATKKDLPKVIKIIKAAFHRRFPGMDAFYSAQQFAYPYYATSADPCYSREIFVKSMISDLKNRFRKPFEFFVAEIDKEMVGFIILEEHFGHFWVNNMMIQKKYQGRSIGKKLFNFVTKNKRPTYLGINVKNPALKFWKKLGFKEILQEVLMVRK